MSKVNPKGALDNGAEMSVALLKIAGSTVPLYQAVKQQITDAIMLGRWPAGTVLPNELALAQQFGVAHGTLRRALVDLTNEGFLSRRRKTGTVVTGRTPQLSLRFFFQYFRLHGIDGSLQHAESRNLSLARSPASEEEKALLLLDEDVEVIRFERVRSAAGKPVMYDRFTLPVDRVPEFPTEVRNAPPLLYQELLERYAIRISAVREQISAAAASAEVASALEITPGSPVLVIDEVAYDQASRPTIVASHHAVTTHHRYVNEIQ